MIIYDTTNPAAIPATAEAVAPYVDGLFGPNHPSWETGWDAAQLARFANTPKVPIACFATTNDGQALDVERGCATPDQAPGWVRMRQAAGIAQPWLYVNRSNGPAVQAALEAAGIRNVAFWIATLDGTQTVTAWSDGSAIAFPVAAVQYANTTLSGGDYDLSITTAFGDTAGVLTGDDMFTDTDRQILQLIHDGLFGSDPIVLTPAIQDRLVSMQTAETAMQTGQTAIEARLVTMQSEQNTVHAGLFGTDPSVLQPPIQDRLEQIATQIGAGAPPVDTQAILSAIADLKAHPTFDPNDATMLGILQKLEAAIQKSGTDLQGA